MMEEQLVVAVAVLAEAQAEALPEAAARRSGAVTAAPGRRP